MAGWRYIAMRLNGDGTETPLSFDVPLAGVQVSEDLSGPGQIVGTIGSEDLRLKAENGDPLFVPWSTSLYAERDGHIRGGVIFVDTNLEGPRLSLDTIGFSGYANDQPYTGELLNQIQVDPMDMARHIWNHLQGQQRGNIGLELDNTTSDVRIGVPETEDNQYDAGPFSLAWWKDHNLGAKFDDLAKLTPFEYRVIHYWDGEVIRHRMQLSDHIGSRRDDLRFVVGENIHLTPPIAYNGDDYADQVMVLGAGEGRKMVRSFLPARNDDRLHRVAVISEKSLQNRAAADRAAQEELRYRMGEAEINQLTILNHPMAPLGSYSVGDEIYVQTPKGWSNRQAMWVRILSLTINTQDDSTSLDVERVI